MKKLKKIVRTMFFSGIAYAISFFISLFLTPYITENIGVDANGFVTLAQNFASYAVIFTTALNSYAVRFIAIEYHSQNMEKVKKYFNSVFFSNLFLGGGIFLIAGVFIENIQHFLHTPKELISDIQLLFLFIFLNFLIDNCGLVYGASAYIKNKVDMAGFFRIISYLMEIAVLWGLYYFFDSRICYVGFGILVSTLVKVGFNIVITHKYIPEFKLSLKCFDFSSVKELVLCGIWNSVNYLGNALNSGLDLWLANIMISTYAMGEISIVKTICTVFGGICQLVTQAFQPIFLKEYSDNNKMQLIKTLVLSMKVSGAVSNILFSCFVVFGLDFYELWIPSQDIETIYVLTIIAIVSYIITGSISPLYYIYVLTVKNIMPCIITIMGGLVNVGGMFWLIRYTKMGKYAIVMTTTVIMIFINAVFNPIYMSKCLEIKKRTIYIPLLKNILICIYTTVIFKVIARNLIVNTWAGLIVMTILFFVLGMIIYVSSIFFTEKIKICKLKRENK